MVATMSVRIWATVVGVWMMYLFQQFWFSPRIIIDVDSVLPGGGLPGVGASASASAGPPRDYLRSHESVDFDPTRLIFLISMGEQAKESKLVERFVWSARHRGEWQGYIVLLTDAPIDRYDGFSHRFVVMNPEARHFNTTFKDDMPYKRFKTRAIEYIEKDARLDEVRLIYYLDVDNIVGNSLPIMFHDLEGKYNIPGRNSIDNTIGNPIGTSNINGNINGDGNGDGNSESESESGWLRTIPRMWFFANKYKHLSVQGGQFVVDRYRSGPCLRAWRETIDANVSESKDQPALHKIRGNGRNQDCQIVAMLPKPHLFFPANSTIHRAVEEIQRGEVLSYPTLVHIKNSCNTTASIDGVVEEIYVRDIVRNAEFSRKIHVRPDR